jgi:energy-coupling factor transport system permease protein
VLDQAAPGGLGTPMLVIGFALLASSVVLTSAGSIRTRYRPDPWTWPEWGTVLAGISALVALALTAQFNESALHPAYSPLAVPALPLLPAFGVLLAALPILVTPPLPEDRT